jgi:diacylglycerol kinase
MALASILLAVYFQRSVAEWLFVFGAIGLVLTTELLNTALEEVCDMLKDTHDL